MPARPTPISTNHSSFSSKSPFSPLPSELPRTPIHGHFAALKSYDDAVKTPITPPAAYTDFLKNTINSPALASPRYPQSPAYTGPMRRHSYGYYTPTTPYPAPISATAKRLRIPPSPCSLKSSAESPASSSSNSPAEEDVDGEVNRGSGSHRQVTVKQVVTTTVTYSAPRMSLLPAPKGKRRRVD